ncbi:hypothetical protein [Micromonospora sp. M61]|uniref:hypothetical protein n=1 Tax=Micromonospora sp. M61 TaxID=2824890 RepID=UPI001B3731B4|nr:hypothetical protein [Micromonospora sp. M61]MBQ0977931.1 hypothetical protein [Micromonospora sp. M61]
MAPEHPYDLDQLVRTLRQAPWMDAAGRHADRLTVIDHADLAGAPGPARLLLLGTPHRLDLRWAAVVTWDAAGRAREAHPSEPFDRAVTEALAAGRRISTARGGVIEFSGDAPEFRRQLPFDPGWSSNALSLVDLAGTPHVHKTYRRLHLGLNEPAAVRRMDGTGYTAAYRGDYVYVEPYTRRRWPLGLLYEYLSGDPLDVPLRENLREMWRHVPTDDRPHDVRGHLGPLEAPLRKVGRSLRGFHRALAGPATGAPFPVAACVDDIDDRLADLLPRIITDQRFPEAARDTAAAGLTAELREAAAEADLMPVSPVAPCHGDLHLGHVLVRRPPGGEWDLRLIDLSPVALEPTDPAFATQSPWQDVVSLHRATEYFTGEEVLQQVVEEFGGTRDQACLAGLELDAGVVASDPRWSPERRMRLRQLSRASDQWQRQVCDLLLAGYCDDPTAAAHPVSRLLYLRRLLHELAYDYDHDRAYFAAMDLRHAIHLARRCAVTAGRRNSL